MDIQQIYLKTPEEWRKWLQENHTTQKEIWLIYYKKHTGKARVPYNEAIEESLCFGWIHSTIKRIDDERYMQKFTPRNPKSNWSLSNKKRIEKLVGLKKMAEAGMRAVEVAKENGKWNEETDAQKTYAFSEEILSLLESFPKAFTAFSTLSTSYKKQYTQWIMSAKKPETKVRRMKEMMRLLESGEKMKMM